IPKYSKYNLISRNTDTVQHDTSVKLEKDNSMKFLKLFLVVHHQQSLLKVQRKKHNLQAKSVVYQESYPLSVPCIGGSFPMIHLFLIAYKQTSLQFRLKGSLLIL